MTTDTQRLREQLHELFKAPECTAYMQKRLEYAHPDFSALLSGRFEETYIDRREFCQKYGFAVPSTDMIRVINGFGKIVEVGAGTGHLATLLDDCIATDIMDGDYGFEYGEHVEKLSAIEAVEKYSDRVPLCVWPSYDSSWAYDMVKTFHVGKTFIYIGEGWGGCTACDKFHDFVRENCWEVVVEAIPQWSGIHDYLVVYQVERNDES